MLSIRNIAQNAETHSQTTKSKNYSDFQTKRQKKNIWLKVITLIFDFSELFLNKIFEFDIVLHFRRDDSSDNFQFCEELSLQTIVSQMPFSLINSLTLLPQQALVCISSVYSG